jgi:hypothetical protein
LNLSRNWYIIRGRTASVLRRPRGRRPAG